MSPTARISAASFRATHAKAAPSRARTVAPAAERTYGGRAFDSKSEAVFASRLDAWKLAGIVIAWHPQRRVPLLCEGGALVGHYVVDFFVELTAGLSVNFENKPRYRRTTGHSNIAGAGMALSLWKMRHFRAQYPKEMLVVVSMARRGLFSCWPDTSLEDLAALAQAGLVLE